MTRFNKKSVGTKTTNLAGGEAFKQTEKLEIASILLTSFVQDQFYRTESDTTKKLSELIANCKDKKFIAKAAIYARKTFGMRSITHIVAAELAHLVKGEAWTKKFYYNVVNRPDDITETLALYLSKHGFPLPHSLMKGFALKLSEFNEYTLAKYQGSGKALKMVDAVNLLHPKGSEALRKLMRGELKSTETWEAKLSEAGKAETEEETKSLKADAWKSLLESNKLGYFALLRNLRNISEQAPDVLPLALTQLMNEEVIKKSLVLPFRFYTAAKELTSEPNARDIIAALAVAMDRALSNCPEFPGKTCVVLDESGSMQSAQCGKISCLEMGALFSAMLYKRNKADWVLFSDDARYHNPNPTDCTLNLMSTFQPKGCGTDFKSIFKALGARQYDQIIILSDMQGWEGYHAPTAEFEAYKRRSNCSPKIYSFDLAGHGTLQFPQSNIYCLAGFSDKVFDIMKLLGEDKNALVNTIESVEI